MLKQVLLSKRRGQFIALSAAVAGMGLTAHQVRATYADADTFIGTTTFNDPTQWSTTALPGPTELAVFPSGLNNSAGITFPTTGTTPIAVYGLSSNAVNGTLASGGVLQLLSTDSASDGATTAPALQVTTGGTSASLDIKGAIVFGNAASISLQTATFENSIADNGVITENKISEFPGSIWGLTIAGTKRVELKGGNYFNAGYVYSGDTTINAGATARIYNNNIPHGPGRGNLVANGTVLLAANSGAEIFNGLNGAVTGAINRISGGSSPGFVVGANDANGLFDGQLSATGITLIKVGSGTQTLTNATNANNKTVTIDGGVLNVTSIANAGTASALGAGAAATNAASLLFDGGILKYTGPAVSADRLFTLNATGGGIDASGTGALNLNNTGAAILADIITRPAEVASAVAGTQAIKMPSTAGIVAGMAVSGGSLPTGDTVVSVDSPTQITVAASRSTAIGSGAGADILTFTPSILSQIDRTFTLSGSNTDANTLAASLGNSPSGGKLSIAKTGSGSWTLSNTNTYTGNTTVNGGTLILGSSLTTSASVAVTGGKLAMAQNGGLVLSLSAPGATPVLTVTGGGQIDLADNDMVLDYTAGNSPLATVKALLKSGFNNGNENGSGIISSASIASGIAGLGYAENSEVNLASVDGVTPDQTAVIVKYTYFGDTNLDGTVTTSDFQRFLDGLAGGGSTWTQGDFTYDGKVDLGNDFNLFLGGYLAQGGALGDLESVISADDALTGSQKAQLLSVVPEPTLIGANAILAAAALCRRKRKTA